MTQKTCSILCLGDSYTIGEAVLPEESFPLQTAALLRQENVFFNPPTIVAQTGWTTDELQAAIEQRAISGHFDFVTLLIGVNNQYRNRDIENYKKEFTALLQTAVHFAGGYKKNVVVISIPDWGVTPFAEKDTRGQAAISQAIDLFNHENQAIAEAANIHYVNITPRSRLAKTQPDLIASDGLHPSGKMYAFWAALVAEYISQRISQS